MMHVLKPDGSSLSSQSPSHCQGKLVVVLLTGSGMGKVPFKLDRSSDFSFCSLGVKKSELTDDMKVEMVEIIGK